MGVFGELGRYYASVGDKLRRRAMAAGSSGGFPVLHIFWQFVAILLGIFAQPVIKTIRETGKVNWDLFSWNQLFVALLMCPIIFPGAYKPQTTSPQPRFVQFCLVFTAGIGWIAIFDTVVK